MRPYEANRIAIEQADLQLDAEIESLQVEMTPYFRSGVTTTFGVKAAHAGVVTLLMDNGKALPSTAVVRIGEREFPVGLRGEVYLTDLAPTNRVNVQMRGQSCEFDVAYVPSSDPQPHLGTYTCRGMRP